MLDVIIQFIVLGFIVYIAVKGFSGLYNDVVNNVLAEKAEKRGHKIALEAGFDEPPGDPSSKK